MNDHDKTKEQLIEDLVEMRQIVDKLKTLENMHKQTEEKLRDSEEKYRIMVESANEPILVAQDGVLKFANQKAVEVIGYQLDELTSRPFVNFIHPDDREIVIERHMKRLKGDEIPQVYPFRIINKNRNILWAEINVVLIKWEKRPATLFSIRDITERKHTEELLKESEKKYSTIVEKGNDGIAIAQQGKVKFANSKLLELFGFSLEETLEKSFIDFIAPEYQKAVMEQYKKRIVGKTLATRYELELNTKDGRKIPVEINASLIEYEGKPADLAIVRDISERKKVEDALRDSEVRYRGLFESSMDGIISADFKGNILECNQAFADMHGYSKQELMGFNYQELIPAKWRNMIKTIVNEQVINRHYSDEYEIEHIKKDGTIFPVSGRGWLIKDIEDRPIGVWGIIRDINERKQAEESLRESEEKFRQLADQSPNMIFINEKGRVVYANKECEEVMGYTQEEFYSPDFEFLNLIAPEYRKLIITRFNKHMEGEEVAPYDYALITKDDRRIEAIITTKLIDYNGERAILGIVTDITDRKRMETALRESEKRYRGLYESSIDGIASASNDGTIVDCNQAFSDILGYTKEELNQLTYRDYVPSKWHDLIAKNINEQVIPRGYSDEFEIEYLRKDGTIFPISVRIWLIKDKKGKPIGRWGIVRDITEHKRAEEAICSERDNLINIMESMEDGVYIVNQTYDIEYVNPTLKKEFGLPEERKCYEYFHDREEDCPWCKIQEIFAGKTVRWEWYSSKTNKTYDLIDTPLKNPDGSISKLEIFRDITKRKEMEEKIKAEKERAEHYLDIAGVIILALNKRGEISSINKKGCEVLHYEDENELIGKNWFETCLPDRQKERVLGIFEALMRGQLEPVEFAENPVLTKHGEERLIAWHNSLIYDETGNIIGTLSSGEDITERKQAEEKLKESEMRYRGLYESSIDGIVSLDLDGRIMECNQAYVDMLGYSREELRNFTVYDLTPPKWLDENKEFHEILLQGVYSEEFEKEYIRKDGTIVPVSIKGWHIKDKDGKMTGMWGVIRDITEHKKAEDELKREKAFTESALDAQIDTFFVFDPMDGKPHRWNKVFNEICGYSDEEIQLMTPFDFYPADEHDRIFAAIQEVLKEGRATVELSLVKKNGQIIPYEYIGSLIKDDEGKQLYICSIGRDITERKKAEEKIKNYTENLEKLVEERTAELKESEGRYRGLYESSIDGIAFTNMEQKIVDCNQAFADMLGYTKEELYQLTLWDITPSKWLDMNKKIFFKQVFAKGHSDEYEKEYIKKDGTIVPISARAWVIKDKEGTPTGSWGIVRDITERKKVDQMQSQFINVAAHELRTPLSALKAHVDLLTIKISRGFWSLPEEVNEKIKIIARNAGRLTLLINNLLDYTRLEAGTIKMNSELSSLENLAIETVKEVNPLTKKHKHEIKIITPKSLPLIYLDKEKINAVFNNLLSNAIKYTPKGGTINVLLTELGNNIHIMVKDTGIGIAEDDLESIFLPFHVADMNTTDRLQIQPEFERTGLGLAITKEYVKMHGGSIWVESQVGEGSNFHVIIPKKRVI